MANLAHFMSFNGKSRKRDLEFFLEIASEHYVDLQRIFAEKEDLLEYTTMEYCPINDRMEVLRGYGHLDRLYEIHRQQLKKEIQGIMAMAAFYKAFLYELIDLGLTDFDYQKIKKYPLPKQWIYVTGKLFKRPIHVNRLSFITMKNLLETVENISELDKSTAYDYESLGTEIYQAFAKAGEHLYTFYLSLLTLDRGKGLVETVLSERTVIYSFTTTVWTPD